MGICGKKKSEIKISFLSSRAEEAKPILFTNRRYFIKRSEKRNKRTKFHLQCTGESKDHCLMK